MDDAPTTRGSLVARLQGERDERAWSEFLTLYEPLVLRLLKQRGLQDADARDAWQQVLLRVSQAIERYQPDGAASSFRRWLFSIARNVVLTFLEQVGRRRQVDAAPEIAESLASVAVAGGEIDQFELEYQRQGLARALREVRGEFRESTWRAFVATAIEGRDSSEVARELNLSIGAVYVARSRVIARLRGRVLEFEAQE